MTVPQVGHFPLIALRPFFITSSTALAISFLALHLTQYPSAIKSCRLETAGPHCGNPNSLRAAIGTVKGKPKGSKNVSLARFNYLKHSMICCKRPSGAAVRVWASNSWWPCLVRARLIFRWEVKGRGLPNFSRALTRGATTPATYAGLEQGFSLCQSANASRWPRRWPR